MAGRDKKNTSRMERSSEGSLASSETGTYSHDDFTYVRRKRGRIAIDAGGEEAGELNIVPYLDIMINLIMFMLVIQTTIVSLGMIDVTAPTYATLQNNGDGPKPTPEANKKKLQRLTVGVAQTGFYIAAVGGVLPGETESSSPGQVTADGVAKTPPTVPLLADGAYDFRMLARKMRGIKSAFPDTEAIYVAADNNIPYEVIVATLDATREDDQGRLFPAVAFTQIN